MQVMCPEKMNQEDTPYLTPGKIYETFNTGTDSFSMFDDEGIELFCLFDNCCHLGKDSDGHFLSWFIVE